MLWEDNYLMHFGIKGQKWGIRRFQNPDGSLTQAGKKRYEADSNRSSQSNALESKGHGLFSRVKKKAYTQTVQSEGEWIRKAGEMVADPKARKKIIKAIDEFNRENPEEAEASRKKSVWLENCMDYYDESYRESSHRWHKDNPGKEWVGDAAEFGNELEKKYPDYKKAKEEFDKAIADYVDDVNKLANNPKFKDKVDLNNCPNLSEKIEGRDGSWYRTANALAWGIASVDSKREINNGYIMPEYFIESRDSNGNILPSPYLSQVNKKEDYSKMPKEQKQKLYNEGERDANKALKELDSIKDPEERGKRFSEMLKKANEALGPYGDSTYPGYDDNGDPKQQAYDIIVCHEIGKRAKSICDPLGISGNGTEGHTPGTKAITDKMQKNSDRESEIWNEMVSDYKKRKKKDDNFDVVKLSSKEFMKLILAHGANSEVQKIRKENYKIESTELREQILKDLGLPVTKENMTLIYPFIYYDDFAV